MVDEQNKRFCKIKGSNGDGAPRCKLRGIAFLKKSKKFCVIPEKAVEEIHNGNQEA